VMRTLDRLIELGEVTSGERQRPPRPSFACSKDRNGRCQLFETRRQRQRQHLSLRSVATKLGTCGTQLSFSSKSHDGLDSLL
jgi:hypothetical protein